VLNKNHWSGYRAWLKYEDALEREVEKRMEMLYLLLVIIFVDDYLSDKSRNSSNTGIYFSLANFSKDLYLKPFSKFCLATFKSNELDFNEVFSIVIWESIQNLINGTFATFFLPTQSIVSFFGGIHCFVSDHIGACEILQRLGPLAKYPSRFFCDNNPIWNILKSEERILKKSLEEIKKIKDIEENQKKYGFKGTAKKTATANGYKCPIQFAMSIYNLGEVFSEDVFLRTPPCELHQNRLGLFLRLLLFFGIKKGKQWCEMVNERIKISTSGMSSLSLMSIPKGIYYFNSKNSNLTNKLAVFKYTGGFQLTLAKVIVAVFDNIIEQTEMDLIIYFLKFMFLVRCEEPETKEYLSDIIFKCKKLWVEIFPPNENRLNLVDNSDDQSENGDNDDSNSEGQELNEKSSTKFSYRFVNFDTMDIWPEEEHFLGPSILYSAELWEYLCQFLRRAKLGNNHNSERDALQKYSNERQLSWIEMENDNSEIGEYDEKKLLVGVKSIDQLSVPQLGDIKSCYWKIHGFSGQIPKQITKSLKFYYYGKVFKSGIYLQVSDSTLLNPIFCKFNFVFSHIVLGREYFWLEVSRFKKYSIGNNKIIHLARETTSDYIPFIKNSFKIVQIQVIEYLNSEEFLINGWVDS
jgi:hypothetical protein